MFFKALRKKGILGMNRRVGDYILTHNERKKYPLVDNKITTYELCKKHNVSQPDHYFHVTNIGQIKKIKKDLIQLKSFCIKPARGAMGNGILVVNEVLGTEEEPEFDTSKGLMNIKKLSHFISDILSGLYSLSGHPDQVIIQEKIILHPVFDNYVYKGIPDIRFIVYKGYPVMAMLRCPTKKSQGRANLHQGAVGCGINIATGHITNCIYLNNSINTHPDTGKELKDLAIPYWEELLVQASKCYEMTQMGYIGVDMVLDKNKGPQLLEINARPGLSIQLANSTGLIPRLELINQQKSNADLKSIIAFCQSHFNA